MKPEVFPNPTVEEAVAIAAAVEAMWPRPTIMESPDSDRSKNWRFSGRWWQRDRFAAAERPW